MGGNISRLTLASPFERFSRLGEDAASGGKKGEQGAERKRGGEEEPVHLCRYPCPLGLAASFLDSSPKGRAKHNDPFFIFESEADQYGKVFWNRWRSRCGRCRPDL